MKSDEQQKLKKYKILYWSKKFTDEYLTTTYLKSLLNNLRANNLFEEVSNIFQNEKVYQHINIYIYIYNTIYCNDKYYQQVVISYKISCNLFHETWTKYLY